MPVETFSDSVPNTGTSDGTTKMHDNDAKATTECWVERKSAELIAKIKRSQYAASCFADARMFMADGYASDVALAIAWNYWK